MSNAELKFFVGGIPSDVRHRDLYEFFRAYGVVKRVTVFNSDKGKKLFGFCFVKFKKIFGGTLDTKQTFLFQGRKLEVDPIVKRSSLKQSVNEKHARRIFLQNLPIHIGKEDVLRIFGRYGEIVNCFVIDRETEDRQRSGAHSRADPKAPNYGYVIFKTKEQAESLVKLKYVELKNRQRIFVKRYCSTINREASEDKVTSHRDQKSVGLNAPVLRSGTTKSIEMKNKKAETREIFLNHYVKPTSRNYGERRASWLKTNHSSNLRFNISLEPPF
jgi:RNA recognition motif-containing protein